MRDDAVLFNQQIKEMRRCVCVSQELITESSASLDNFSNEQEDLTIEGWKVLSELMYAAEICMQQTVILDAGIGKICYSPMK